MYVRVPTFRSAATITHHIIMVACKYLQGCVWKILGLKVL